MKKILKLECPNCRASLEFTEKRDNMFCQYCGTKIMIDNDNEHIFRYIDESKIKENENEYMLRMKKMEIDEQRRKDNEKKNIFKIKLAIGLGIIGIFMVILGYFLGSASGNSNSPFYMLSLIGLFPLFVAGSIIDSCMDSNNGTNKK
jgi:hypothetical protein